MSAMCLTTLYLFESVLTKGALHKCVIEPAIWDVCRCNNPRCIGLYSENCSIRGNGILWKAANLLSMPSRSTSCVMRQRTSSKRNHLSCVLTVSTLQAMMANDLRAACEYAGFQIWTRQCQPLSIRSSVHMIYPVRSQVIYSL